MSESQRDAGLLRAVGPWGLGAGIVNGVVGAGIFAVPAALAAAIGPFAPLVFLGCAVAVGSAALCFAEGGSRVPTSGGANGCVSAAFGPFAGYVVGTLMWFSDALACGAVSAALADAIASVLPPVVRATARVVVIVGVVGGIALVNMGGVARGVSLVRAATVLKLAPLAVFLVAGAGAVHLSSFGEAAQPTASALGRALILGFFACEGMETALCASGEVRDPTRTIPRALGVAVLFVTLLYTSIQAVAQGILGRGLAVSTVPLADAMAEVSPELRALMVVGAAVSMFGWIGSDVLGTPRILFAFARDGLLPPALGRVHPRTHAPHVAILCYAALSVGIAVSGTFAELAVLSTLAIAPLYIAGCAASYRLARRGVALAGAPLGLDVRWLGAAMATGIASQLAMIAVASRAEVLGLLGAIAAAAALYPIMIWLRRAREER